MCCIISTNAVPGASASYERGTSPGTTCSPGPEFDVRVRELPAGAAVVLLVALLAAGALTEDGGFAGWARPAGVLVGGLLAWRRAPFVVVVLGAAATAAVLRAVGVG
ncbi:AzlD domain-containing protein [Streptomyces sp. CA-210063]|uniref:AzlD domain-containing protein n=1 Tax=Streptomyces sp. CA-210063 TaxID=2801029 RepID=UPI00214BAF0C|nr:AzlD domain-containing protein [Streptomyces sp. CA-210063]UUU31629.1 AzlD domain-containing protein [Streptomyces sp. CA-210063]